MAPAIRCHAKFREFSSHGLVRLDQEEIFFRGRFQLKIPLRVISAVEAADGRLTVTFQKNNAIFELGKVAEKWRDQILNPAAPEADKPAAKPAKAKKKAETA